MKLTFVTDALTMQCTWVACHKMHKMSGDDGTSGSVTTVSSRSVKRLTMILSVTVLLAKIEDANETAFKL